MKKTQVPKITALDVEVAAVWHFGWRQNLIVPNVSWGLFHDNHEADLVVLRNSGYADEVEIKVSRSDILADLKKRHGRGHVRSVLMRRLWFAVPEELADDPNIPAFAGILAVRKGSRYARVVRHAEENRNAQRLSERQRLTLLRLGCMRVWSLKEKERRRLNLLRADYEDAEKWRRHINKLSPTGRA